MRTPDPKLVLLVATVLPGMGHVLIGKAQRGLLFAFSALVLAWISTKIAPPEATPIGRYALGLFVWAISILEAYRSARFAVAVRRQIVPNAGTGGLRQS